MLDKRKEDRQNSINPLRRFGYMLRRTMIPALLFLCAFPLRAQVEARQATPEEVSKAAQTKPATQTEVPSPMLLEVPLAGNGTPAKPHVVDLPKDRTRVIKDTAAYVCDQMTVQSVSIRKRPAKKGRIELVVVPTLRTEYYRQKVDVAVALMDGEREIRSWKNQLVLGLSAGDIIRGGALGAANPDKAESPEIVWSFDSEEQMREQIGSPGAKLRIVVGIVE
jgi:hypothetical protein